MSRSKRPEKAYIPKNIARDVSPERLKRFFEKSASGYSINKAVREMCIFAKQNMVKDPPFSKIDFVSCRNVLIYFDQELQKRAISILFYALRPKGFLMIGPSETVGEFAGLFSMVDKKHSIYSPKADQAALSIEPSSEKYVRPAKQPNSGMVGKPATALTDILKQADSIVIAKYSPAGFVVDDSFKILQFRGDIGPYFRPASGEASLDLLKMVGEDLVSELRTALHRARKEGVPVRKERHGVKQDKLIKYINIDVVPFKAPAPGALCFLVLFQETGNSGIGEAGLKSNRRGRVTPRVSDEIAQLRQELAVSKANLYTVTQEHETANEELRALNEELQSGNEELQSINEEMETAKEELQSTNEELTTVNDELQSRNEETMRLNNDLVNILRGVEIPIIILGAELRIRRFNDAAAKLLNLISTDEGRPLSDIRTSIKVPDLEQMVLDVGNTLAVKEKEVQDMEGRWYSLTIRPYRTVDNRIDGVLMTLVNINDIKLSLLRIREAYDYANDIVETVREPLLILESDLKVITANRSFYENFMIDPAEIEGRYFYELGNGEWNIPDLMKQLRDVLPEKRFFSDLEVAIDIGDMGRRTMLLNAREIRKDISDPIPVLSMEKSYAGMILLSIEDITKRKKAEEALQSSSDRYRSYIEVTGALGWTTNADGEIVEDLPSWRLCTGQTYDEIKGHGWSKALHPEDLKTALHAWGKAVARKKSYTVEYRIRRHDGVYRDFLVRGKPVLNEDGTVREWVGTCIDITERKKHEEVLKRLNQKLQSTASRLKTAYKDMESFSYSISHDLKEPLLIIDWSIGNILKKIGKNLDDEGKEMLDEIRTTSNKMERLIDALLCFSRMSTKDIVKSDIDMRALAQNVIEDMKASIGMRNAEFRITDLPPAWADPFMIHQVFVNLLSNALKYARPYKKAVLEINGSLQDDELVYSVKDYGIGFDMNLKDKLFGFFQRIHSSKEVEGHGIGLVIVKNIIGKHGGRVWAEGKPDEGATFYFTLPRKEE
jgi:PAS domain S-box-containing protein